MREIRMLRAMWRELETGLRSTLLGHAGGNPGYSQGTDLTGYRASSRPYRGTGLSTQNNADRSAKLDRIDMRVLH